MIEEWKHEEATRDGLDAMIAARTPVPIPMSSTGQLLCPDYDEEDLAGPLPPGCQSEENEGDDCISRYH